MAKAKRDYFLLKQLQDLDDDTLVGAVEVATLLDISPVTVRHRKVPGFPAPMAGLHLQRWRLGPVRQWIRKQDCRHE